MTHNWLKVGSYRRHLQALAKAAQADSKPKLWQRACKSEARKFEIFLPRADLI